MASVIVPAHNEAAVIQRCLDSLITQTGIDTLIVACNGCSDNTADLVKHYSNIICLEIDTPSKTNALNEAEKHISSYPIFYLDADTQLQAGAIQHIINQLNLNPNLHLVAPTPDIDSSQSSWLVQQYYKIWLNLPYIKAGVIATCSFIVTEEGRKRFDHFPAIINDDRFIHCQFKACEVSNIAGAEIYIQAPRTLYSLIKIKTRARLGNIQLQQLGLCPEPKHKSYGNSIKSLLFSRKWLAASVYYSIATVIRIRSWIQFKRIDNYTWEKDLSSR
jgi:glycosyltransferase involved in cell wall biosynthesis